MAICRASGELVCVYAVGNVEAFPSGVDPNKLYVGTTWVRLKGKVVVGVDESQSEFNTVDKIGGTKTVQLTSNQMPTHIHIASCSTTGKHYHNTHNWASTTAGSGVNAGRTYYGQTGSANTPANPTTSTGDHSHTITIGNAGGGQAHNNLQPYITKFLWERTA